MSKEIDTLGEQLHARSIRMASQLGNWTMTANAGGIAFVLTTARAAEPDILSLLGKAYVVFLFGLGFGFAGHVAVMLAVLVASQRTAVWSATAERAEALTQLIAEMKSRNVPPPTELLESRAKIAAKADTVGDTYLAVAPALIVGVVLYAGAAILAGWGLLTPLSAGLF